MYRQSSVVLNPAQGGWLYRRMLTAPLKTNNLQVKQKSLSWIMHLLFIAQSFVDLFE
jgi:hypothetical protein